MTIRTLVKYPIDLTGVASSNYVTEEAHIAAPGTLRLIIPNCGAFYTSGLLLYGVNESNGVRTLLTRVTHFQCYDLNIEASRNSGLETAVSIVVFPSVATNSFILDYHIVGGPDATKTSEVIESYNDLTTVSTAVDWANVKNKPQEGFNPDYHHYHDIRDLYNAQYFVNRLAKIVEAINITDKATHDSLYVQINKIITDANTAGTNAINAAISGSLSATITATNTAVEDIDSFSALRTTELANIASANTDSAETVDLVNNKVVLTKENIYCAVLGLLDKQFRDSDTLGYPVLSHIDGLELYLDASDASSLFYLSDGTIEWRDNASLRYYTSESSSNPSIIKSLKGLGDRVVKFNGGQKLTQHSGPALNLQSPFTIFIVYAASTYSGSTGMYFLSKSDGLLVKTLDEDASNLLIKNIDNTRYLYSATNNSTGMIDGNIVVANIPHLHTSDGYCLGTQVSDATTRPDGINHTAYSPESINHLLDTIGYGAAASSTEGELASIVIYNRQLKTYEVECVLHYLNNRFKQKINMVSNPFFNLDLGGFESDYTPSSTLAVNPSIYITEAYYRTILPGNPAYQDSRTVGYKPGEGKYLAVRGGSNTLAFWRDTVLTDNDALYELNFDIVYGLTSLPVIKLKINGSMVFQTITLSTTQAVQKNVSFSFRAPASTTVVELFNINTSSVGNTFGIDNVRLSRNMFVNL